MPRIVVAGGGVVGLSAAMLLARDGCDVTVLERDPQPVPGSPDAAWQAWDRHGIAQFRQPHYLHARGRHILDDLLPGVTGALLAAGGTRFDPLTLMPPFIADRSPRDSDERFVTVTARRPVIEYAVATCAAELDVRRGVTVTGLLTGPGSGVPHVTGVRTADGEELPADLVIDAMGRRSELPRWLAALGARPMAEEAEDSGFTYYTRYFTGTAQPAFLTGLLTYLDSFSLLTLPGDNGTWSVTVFISSRDQVLKQLRHPEKWTAVVAACPLHAHLLDGEPVTGILPMSGIADRHRRAVVDGTPVATGILAVGDAQCCTNPSLGRGITMGLIHAEGTAEVIRDHLGDPLGLALAHDRMTQERITPWYRQTVELDRARLAQIEASIAGRLAAGASPFAMSDATGALPVAMLYDADVFRVVMELVSMLALPTEIMARPGFAGQVARAAEGREPVVIPAPSRGELLAKLA
jgi:2-polyprenyl-6-methoxyphenol hydroxylase-like FAD-dependent oxidoreductase